MKKILSILGTLALLATTACSSDDSTTIDEEKPTISVNFTGGFPQACESLKRGETYTFSAKVTDNDALAAYSINLHHNFDHHTHDDQGATCDLSPIKSPVNPMLIVENYTIEEGPKEFTFSIEVTIPEDIDVGDYHCGYSVTDQTGWQSRTSIDLKIVE
ncbi:DUF4625 domain-containing protein [Flavobacterium sp. ASW18X]|uniref:DUF4625 domain-containing protein n=1 Tax=Flavobacterium sp. ASW18X TaxID=2572595 RepID=UPI0010AE2914|nr:DUF4625 domain-containing protein [Flavobacterium sp. ASW18X]TKD61426.1 DUF4625 domain-containing protein [Flavobacterium sp. ASW18X]